MYFYGNVGTGKTCAAVSVYTHWAKPGDERLLYFSVCPELTAAIARMEGFERHQTFKRIADAHLFVLDDIGRRKLTDEQAEIIIQITELRQEQPTIYTGNWSPDELPAKIGDARIASRILQGMHVVQFTGPDRRLQPVKAPPLTIIPEHVRPPEPRVPYVDRKSAEWHMTPYQFIVNQWGSLDAFVAQHQHINAHYELPEHYKETPDASNQ